MVRKLLATTALVTLLSGAAYAQDATQPAPAAPAPATEAPAAPVAKADGFLATNLIGETVYNGTGDNAENIGQVNDVVIGSDGNIESIVIGVGGFLGIGSKNVAMNYGDIEWAERDGDRWIVVNATKEQLEAQAEFDRRPYDPAPAADTTATAPAPSGTMPSDDTAAAPPAPADDTTAKAPAAPADDTTAQAPAPADDTTAQAPAAPSGDTTAQTPAAPADDSMAEAPATPDETQTGAIDKSQLTEMPAGDIRAETLVGTTVYGANDANIGEIGDVVLTQDGKVDAVIIDVGGFLGVGEKEVAVGMDNLAFMTDASGNKYLYTNFSKEQLDAAAAYDKSTWAENRDTQRIIMR